MKKRIISLFLALLLAAAFASGALAVQGDHYPVTIEVYNNARELVPYTFDKAPERTLVYGRNNVEILLALGLEDNILMVADCSSVLPEYEAAFQKLDLIKNHQEVGYFVKEYALSLEPDMVIGWYSLFNMADRMGDVDFWHERHIGTYTTTNSVLRDNESLENEYKDIRISPRFMTGKTRPRRSSPRSRPPSPSDVQRPKAKNRSACDP